MTGSLPSMRNSGPRSPVVSGDLLAFVAPLYAGATELTHPVVSPLYAEFGTRLVGLARRRMAGWVASILDGDASPAMH
jgi:hypothetical protein